MAGLIFEPNAAPLTEAVNKDGLSCSPEPYRVRKSTATKRPQTRRRRPQIAWPTEDPTPTEAPGAEVII